MNLSATLALMQYFQGIGSAKGVAGQKRAWDTRFNPSPPTYVMIFFIANSQSELRRFAVASI
jgi:hypothetical protein